MQYAIIIFFIVYVIVIIYQGIYYILIQEKMYIGRTPNKMHIQFIIVLITS